MIANQANINANALNTFALSLRATKGSVAIRRSRCEGEARGNLNSSFAPLRTRLRRFTPRNDILLDAFVFVIKFGFIRQIRPHSNHSFGSIL
jgi:hypothetical protein